MSDPLQAWVAWQREHAEALADLQEAQRTYHRTIAGSAFANPTEGPTPMELQKEALAALEAARQRLDEVRGRQPGKPNERRRAERACEEAARGAGDPASD